ncbi:hypothetical protein DMB92_04955 [Campylobacter sp. MIT 99-7217]|uniref:GDYXXLXY domain-containing protein n=1 Tax=Campylobacter sp. MIT 99-7217 TaxID=535091 RepID=UPI001156D3C5|nr:GDYXXLXY domain-containing protein [Campylobacter sp. MIT 99-7217]TQR32449.1 hypothetical protein DMB92_04955 [Campylobacter sp. MIT 99-7217]
MKISKFLIFALALQFLVIIAMFINAYLPVFFGQELKVRASGFDPRDLLSGNYVLLDYGVHLEEPYSYQGKDTYFVELKDEDQDGIYEFSKPSLEKPKNAPFIKAKLKNSWPYDLDLGIEKYFAPAQKALELERDLLTNQEAIVTIKIFDGKARIIDLYVRNEASLD